MNRALMIILTRAQIVVLLLAASVVVRAQEPKAADPKAGEEPSPAELAKKLSNPISDLVSVPFQANWNQDVGPYEDTQFVLNIQPVIPFTLSKNWNLIARAITPIIGQPPLVPGGPAPFGFGDIFTSFFLSPAKSKVIWGVGPAFSLPTSADPYLGSGKWSAGPTFVVLKQSGALTAGLLWNYVWSFAGDAGRSDVSQMFTQPFLAYQKKAYTFTLMSEMSTNDEAASGQKWTIPIELFVSKISWFGPFPASYQIGGGYFVEKPDGGPTWRLRVLVAILLPRKK